MFKLVGNSFPSLQGRVSVELRIVCKKKRLPTKQKKRLRLHVKMCMNSKSFVFVLLIDRKMFL